MHLAFRLDKRAGESHMALDGKKTTPLFWAQEENGLKTISLYRTSLWLHDEDH
jgi:hypothetical protein